MRRRLAGLRQVPNNSSDDVGRARAPTVPSVTGRGRHRLAASVLVVALGHGVRRWWRENKQMCIHARPEPHGARVAAAPATRRRRPPSSATASASTRRRAAAGRRRSRRPTTSRSRGRWWSTGAGSSGTIPIRRSSSARTRRAARWRATSRPTVAEMRRARERIVEVDRAPLDFVVVSRARRTSCRSA